jgi:hypothetical protein
MCNKWSSRFLAVGAAALMTLAAQETPLNLSSVKINLPADSPLSLMTLNLGESRAVRRGSAVVLDLHMALTLRNISSDVIRGVTLLVMAQEVTPGGRASHTLPAMNVEPGQVFTTDVSMQLMRPGQNTAGTLVEVDLDGVLFKDLSFYGKNRLDSRRALTAYQVEAQRDRQYFKQILARFGPDGLQRDVVASIARQAERPRLNVAVTRGRAVASAVVSGNERLAKFAFLQFPDSPVQPVEGSAQISGNEARSPDIEIRNKTDKPVRYVEIGWIVKDQRGGEFMAASVPASGPAELYLPARKTARVLQNSTLKFTQGNGHPVAIAGMTGFVSQVEFANGQIWVPDRESLQNLQLLRVLAPSTEEQRLTDFYRKHGIKGLIEELNKF